MAALVASAALLVFAASSAASDEGQARAAGALTASRARHSTFWTWDDGREPVRRRLDTDDVRFPPGFLWGVASAAHQVEGGCANNNWARWEEGRDAAGAPRPRAGAACEHWTRFREDIELMRSLGLTSYRFSIEWSKIEPAPGVFDGEAIAHYHEVLDALRAAGIAPMITLFHFTIPAWFEELGGFEVESNNGFFVAFAQRAFAEYGGKCELWCTVNEPEVYVEGGYSSGKFPPCKQDMHLAAVVLRNLLEAHVLVYAALKAMPGGAAAQIGLVKDIFQFEPYNAYSPLDTAAASIVDSIMNESILRFLRTGHFSFWMPGQVRLTRTNTRAPASYDFIGLNYYSHHHVRVRLPSARAPHPFELLHLPREEALMTDLAYPMYPEGFYHALVRVGKLGKPVYVTESGVADARDDIRSLHLRRYLYALSCALADGVDVRGYYHWTLMDNFEWAEGYAAKFGLFACDPQSQVRVPRPSADVLRRIIARHASGEAVLQPREAERQAVGAREETLPLLPADGRPTASLAGTAAATAAPAGGFSGVQPPPVAATMPSAVAAEGLAAPSGAAEPLEVVASLPPLEAAEGEARGDAEVPRAPASAEERETH